MSWRQTKSRAPIMRDAFRLARCRDPQIGAPLRPGAGEIGMGERLGFVGKQQHDVAGQRLLLQQAEAQAASSTASASWRPFSVCRGRL